MLHRRSASNGSTWKEARTMLHTSKHAAFCWTTQGFGRSYCVSITHHTICSWCLTKQCLLHLMVQYQFITKQSSSSYAHLMQYSGPAAAEQTQMDGSCQWQHWILHPHGKLHMLLSSLLTRSLVMLVWLDLNPLPSQQTTFRNSALTNLYVFGNEQPGKACHTWRFLSSLLEVLE